MEIQILSDLHLEAPKSYDIFNIVPKAPYLALLGDIGNAVTQKEDCLNFLTRQLMQFRIVLFVPGNHEPYRSDWPRTMAILRTFEQEVREDPSLGEFVLLDRVIYRLPGTNVTFLGCSLFSSVPAQSESDVSFGVNDFYHILDWDVSAHNEAHRRDLAWLNAQVAELEREESDIIILTHWSPSRDPRTMDPRHADSPISSAFSTDLAGEHCFRSGSVKLWAFGHTHHNCDLLVERDGASPLRLFANQRGYYFAQAEGYDGERIVSI